MPPVERLKNGRLLGKLVAMASPLMTGRILPAVLILMGLAGAGYWLKKPKELSEKLRFDPQLAGDYQVLDREDANTSPERVALALLRLNGVRSLEGKREALRRSRDPRPAIRKAVAESLAIAESDPDVSRTQEALLFDPDREVRFAALRGLAFSTEPGRNRLLEVRLANAATEPLERLTAHAGLSRSGLAGSERIHLSLFRTELESSIGKPHFADAIRILVRLSPDDPGCIRLAERLFASGAVPEPLLPEMYSFLARRSPVFVSARVMTDIRSPVLPLRNTVINNLSTLCPPERWKAIQWVVEGGASPEPVRMLALQAAESLGVRLAPGMRVPQNTPRADRCVSRR